MKKLAKAASRFIQEQVEEIEDFTHKGEEIGTDEFTKKGILIYPPYCTLEIGEIKTFGFRVKRINGISMDEPVKAVCEDKGIRVITPEFRLFPTELPPKNWFKNGLNPI